jgi:hypothetical protein
MMIMKMKKTNQIPHIDLLALALRTRHIPQILGRTIGLRQFNSCRQASLRSTILGYAQAVRARIGYVLNSEASHCHVRTISVWGHGHVSREKNGQERNSKRISTPH